MFFYFVSGHQPPTSVEWSTGKADVIMFKEFQLDPRRFDNER